MSCIYVCRNQVVEHIRPLQSRSIRLTPWIDWTTCVKVYESIHIVPSPCRERPSAVRDQWSYYTGFTVPQYIATELCTTLIKGILWHQMPVSKSWISNCNPKCSIGCNCSSPPWMPVSGTKVFRYVCRSRFIVFQFGLAPISFTNILQGYSIGTPYGFPILAKQPWRIRVHISCVSIMTTP